MAYASLAEMMALEPQECVQYGEECGGRVEYRLPLSPSGRAFPRCANHWLARLERQRQIDGRYPDSRVPSVGFDPSYAGERWNEED